MRFNSAYDVFCHTAEEVKKIIEDRGFSNIGVYATPPSDGTIDSRAESTVMSITSDTVTSDTVCYIEADTEDDVRVIITDAGLNIQARPVVSTEELHERLQGEEHPDTGQ
jgi:hypothetical protein